MDAPPLQAGHLRASALHRRFWQLHMLGGTYAQSVAINFCALRCCAAEAHTLRAVLCNAALVSECVINWVNSGTSSGLIGM
jgi:hypothetical protein